MVDQAMKEHLFYSVSAFALLIGLGAVLLATALVGFLVGRFASRRMVDRSEVGTIQASVLGMLGLMLGFTFGVASSRYDTRRVLAVDEANAIGTTFMRAQTLPEPYRSSLSDMLRRHVDLRVKTLSVVDDPEGTRRVRRETEKLQQAMWKQAAGAAKEYPNDITGLFLESLNESIDILASRVAEYSAHVPGTVLWILTAIAVAALGLLGYGLGLVGQRSWLVMALVAGIVAAIVVMIIDLDNPQAGPTRISQQTMLDLRNSLSGFDLPGR